MNIWQDRINAAYDPSQREHKMLAEIYCIILDSGKNDGEYSERDTDVLTKISDILGPVMINVLDSAVLENIRISL